MIINVFDLQRFAKDPAYFRSKLVVDTGNSVGLFNPDPWQAEELAMLDPLWLRAVGLRETPELPRGWIGRARGHSKTTDQAMMVMWALAFAPRPVRGMVAAASREQAQILRDRISMLTMLNPWLSKVLDIDNYKVRNRMRDSPAYTSCLDIISSDAASQYGETSDFILLDELTHWKSEDLFTAMFSTAGKRERCLLLIMTNAGHIGTWQHRLFEEARGNRDSVFAHHKGPQASWVTAKMLAEQRRKLSKKSFERLWLNLWQVEGGDALEASDVEAAVNREIGALVGPEAGWEYVAGLDLSTKRHRSALVVLGSHREMQRIKLVYSRSWKPGADGFVPLLDVQRAVVDAHLKFRLSMCCYDPYQAAFLVQQIRMGTGLRFSEMSFSSGKNCNLMASTILEVFRSRQIDLFGDEELIEGLIRLQIVQKKFGYKLEADETQTAGHADKAFALAIALPAAVELSSIVPVNPFTDRSPLMTMQDMHNRISDLEKQATLEAEIAAAVAGGSYLPAPISNLTYPACPHCGANNGGYPICSGCGRDRNRSSMSYVLEETGTVLEEDEDFVGFDFAARR